MNKRYAKGANFERFLVEKFSANGFIAMRIAGSGRYSALLPDLLVMKNGKVVAIQCKITKNKKAYLKKDVENLKKLKEIGNIKCLFAIKFLGEKESIRFYDVENVNETIDINDPYLNYENFVASILNTNEKKDI